MNEVGTVTRARKAPAAVARGRGTGGSGRMRKEAGELGPEMDLARQYLDIAGTMLLVLDARGTVRSINRKGCEMLGLPEQKILGHNWFSNFLHARVREDVRAMFSKCLAEGGPEQYETAILTKSGAERIISWRSVTLRDGKGKATGTLSSGEDITERRQAAEREALQAMRLKALDELDQKMDAPENEMLDFCLDVTLQLVQSELSFIVLMDRQETAMTVHAWSKKAMAQCALDDKPLHFPVGESGLWGDCVRQRKPIIVNDYDAPIRGKKGCLKGHVPLRRLLCVPIFEGQRIAAVVAAANKDRAYDQEDVRSLVMLMNKMWELLRRKRMEAELKQGEKRYRELVDNLSDAVCEIDSSGNVTFVSHQVRDIFGLEPEECVGRSLTEMVHPDSVAGALEALSKVQSSGSIVEFEYKALHKNGSMVFGIASGKMVEEGGDIRIVGVLKDITERKKAEEALRQSEERYRGLVDNAVAGVVTTDIEGRLTFVNRALSDGLGFRPEELIGKPFTDFLHPEDVGKLLGMLQGEGKDRAKDAHIEFRVLHRDGHVIHCYSSPTISYTDGEVAGFNAIIYDISERKRAEVALAQTEKRYRTLVESLQEGLGMTDPSENFIYTNAAFCKITGHSEEELRKMNLLDITFPEDLPMMRSEMAERRGGRKGTYEVRQVRRDGSVRHVRVSAVPWLGENGEFLGSIGLLLDVTEQKKAEAALRESEEKYKELVENINDVIFSVDKEGTLTYISPVVQRVLGMAPAEMTGRPFSDFVHPEDLAFARSQFSRVLDGNTEPSEYRLVTRTGEARWVRTSGRPVRLSGGITGLAGTLNDITDRKLSDEALKTSEQRFRLLAENAQDMIYRVRLQPRLAVEYVSPSALAITGYAPEEYYAEPVLGFGLIPFEGHPEHEGVSWVKEALGRPRTMRWERKDGGTVWLELVNHPVLNVSGQLLAVEGVARDITARKTVEDALRESEEKFRDLAEQSPNMIFINVKGRIVYANRRCEELMGYTRDEFYSPGFDFMDLAAPDCRALVAEKYGAHLSGREVAPYEYAIVTRGGKRIEAMLSTKPINYGGEPGLLGTITDISERKAAEKALRESEEKYRRLFESAPQGIVTLDLEGRVMEVNAAGLKIMNLRRDEVVGRFFAEIPGADSADLPGLTGQFMEFLQGEVVERLEIRIRTPQGDVWQEIFPAILEKDGEPQAIQILMRDITERKLADEKVRSSLREKEVLLKEIHHRVKNNLQIIHSLLNMQARKDRDGRVADALRESQNRVRTMALIHERLYRSTDLSEIDFGEYINRLVGELYSSFGANAGLIRPELELQDVKLGIDSAIPCGFIINELVSNSLKHAFQGGRRGRLLLSLGTGADGSVRLSVGDDGPGLPEGLDFKKTETLGLQLVCALVDQLRGTIELDRANGTEFRIVFNPVKPEVD